mgnify:CR=1 FL=1
MIKIKEHLFHTLTPTEAYSAPSITIHIIDIKPIKWGGYTMDILKDTKTTKNAEETILLHENLLTFVLLSCVLNTDFNTPVTLSFVGRSLGVFQNGIPVRPRFRMNSPTLKEDIASFIEKLSGIS